MKAVELIPKLVTRRYTGNETVEVVLRFVKGGDPIRSAQSYLVPQYGPARSFKSVEFGDPTDRLGKLIKPHEIAVRCVFDLDSAIMHIMALPDNTQIRT